MKRSCNLALIIAFACIAILILDGKTALSGARDGIVLSLETVIPSLFPFLFLSIYITGNAIGSNQKILRFFGRLLHIPTGAESILIPAFLGGYPTGAQAVAEIWSRGDLSKQNAEKMLSYCSNAGPSFLFGMISSYIPKHRSIWQIWGIILVSCIVVAQLFPCEQKNIPPSRKLEPITITVALKSSVTVTASICGWVILFRILMSFLTRWFLWLLPDIGQAAVIGFLELTNGICTLNQIVDERIRFVFCCGILTFGGICVGMQTASVVRGLSLRYYWIGKFIQALISIALAFSIQYRNMVPVLLYLAVFLFFLVKMKKSSSIPCSASV